MDVLDETLEGNYVYIVDEPESEHEGEDVMVYGNVEGEIFGENELQVEVQMMEEQRTDVKGKQILSEHPHVKVNEQSQAEQHELELDEHNWGKKHEPKVDDQYQDEQHGPQIEFEKKSDTQKIVAAIGNNSE